MHVFIYLEMQYVENYDRPISTTDLQIIFLQERVCVAVLAPRSASVPKLQRED